MLQVSKFPVALMNASIFTPLECTIRQYRINLQVAEQLIREYGFIPAIWHSATAETLSALFNINCPANRINFLQEVGQCAIVFRLKERQAEGVILNKDEIERIGYDLLLMERIY